MPLASQDLSGLRNRVDSMETKIENLVKALARQAEMVVVLRELVDPLPSISFKRFGLQGMATDISCVHG